MYASYLWKPEICFLIILYSSETKIGHLLLVLLRF